MNTLNKFKKPSKSAFLTDDHRLAQAVQPGRQNAAELQTCRAGLESEVAWAPFLSVLWADRRQYIGTFSACGI